MELWGVFVGILYVIIIAAIIISVIFYKHLPKPFKLLAFLFFTDAFFETCSVLLRNFSKDGTNLFISPLANLTTLIIISVFYLKYVLRRGQYRILYIVLSSLSIFLVFRDVIYALEGDFQNLHFMSLFYSSMMIAVFTITYFLQIAMVSDMKIVRNYLILSIVFFLQALFGMLFAVAINFMINESLEIVSYFWVSRISVLMITNVVLMFMIWKLGRTRKRLQSD
jgi:hypothetical protein